MYTVHDLLIIRRDVENEYRRLMQRFSDLSVQMPLPDEEVAHAAQLEDLRKHIEDRLHVIEVTCDLIRRTAPAEAAEYDAL